MALTFGTNLRKQIRKNWHNPTGADDTEDMAATRAGAGHSLRLGWRGWLIVGVILVGVILISGCRPYEHRTACLWSADEGAASLPQTVRTAFHLDLSKLPGDIQPVAFAGNYRSLTEQDCQCLAAQSSRLGSALEAEQGLAAPHGHVRKGTLQEAILETAALEARNKDAGTALDLFYRLAEAEARRDLLDDSLKQVNDAVASGQKLKKQGLKVPAEFEQFQNQQLDLQADSVRLDAAIEQLNRNLAKMLNLKVAPERERLWPSADFQLADAVPAADDAVAVGLAHRPELLLLRKAREEAGRADLAAVRKLLAASNMLLGLNGSGSLAKLRAVLCANETGVRREQLEQLAAQRESEVADEIREAVDDMRMQTRLVALAKTRTLRAGTKLKDIEAKRAKGTLSAVDVAPVRLAWLKARSELIHEVMARHIARIKLRQSQGMLVAECGGDVVSGSSPAPHRNRRTTPAAQ
jgi:hypothetical protein